MADVGAAATPGLDTKGKNMAYMDFATSPDAHKARDGSLRRWIASLFAARQPVMVYAEASRKLAGPMPGDIRARGYMADLDIEVGF